MAGFDYDYKIGPDGGPFIDLIDFADNVRTLGYGDAGKRGSNIVIPYKDGEFSDSFKFRNAKALLMDIMVSYTDSVGAVTSPDGIAGHFHENLQELKRLFGGDEEAVFLRATLPFIGDVEAKIEYMGGIEPAGPRMRWVFPVRMLEGSWRELPAITDTEASISSFPHAYTIATGGDTPIGDGIYTFTCNSDGDNPSLEFTADGQLLSAAGSFTAGDVLVANLRTSEFTLNGVGTAVFSKNRAFHLRLPPDQAALALEFDADSGNWDVDVDWNNRWL